MMRAQVRALYGRHERLLLAWFLRRTAAAHLAVDLTYETMARLLDEPDGQVTDATPIVHALGLGQAVLVVSQAAGQVSAAARRRHGLPTLPLSSADVWAVDELTVTAALEPLEHEERIAVVGSLLEDRPEALELHLLGCSDFIKRVDGGGGPAAVLLPRVLLAFAEQAT